jgi:CBS domain-containing protein
MPRPRLLPQKTRVIEIMTSPLITIEPDATIGDVMRVMIERNVRQLFVVENGKMIGRVTQTGLFERMLSVMTDLSSIATQL